MNIPPVLHGHLQVISIVFLICHFNWRSQAEVNNTGCGTSVFPKDFGNLEYFGDFQNVKSRAALKN